MSKAEPNAHPAARILLADDDRDTRVALAAGLRADGHLVYEEPDGGRLLVRIGAAYARRGPREDYDVLVSDVRMPVCTGIQILEGLRRAGWTTAIVLITAFCDEPTTAKARAFGATVLRKPVSPEDLRVVVRRLLGVTHVTGG